MLKDRVNYFDLREAFAHPDENFCKHWGIDVADLNQSKAKRYRQNDEEKDILWQYVNTLWLKRNKVDK